MLNVTEHSDLLSAQYLVKCLDHENVCHNITTLDQPPRMMKHTLYSKHHTTIAPLLADTTKESLKAVHTAAISKSRRKQTVNRVLRDRPPDISETETSLRRHDRGVRLPRPGTTGLINGKKSDEEANNNNNLGSHITCGHVSLSSRWFTIRTRCTSSFSRERIRSSNSARMIKSNFTTEKIV